MPGSLPAGQGRSRPRGARHRRDWVSWISIQGPPSRHNLIGIGGIRPPNARGSCSSSRSAQAAPPCGLAASGGRGTSHPLPSAVVKVLTEHKGRQADERAAAELWADNDLVFTTSIGTPIEPRNLSRHFEALQGRAGVRKVRFHDLRHSCASLLFELGVPLRMVMEILGHSQIRHDVGPLHACDAGAVPRGGRRTRRMARWSRPGGR
jgi:integrase